jgi:cation transport regulator ChaC
MQYFAYGSNMSLRRLRTRVPSAVKLGNATLFCHQLKFHKRSQDGSAKCDAMTALDSAHRVLGVVFEIAASDKPELDRKEGLGQGYAAKNVQVMLTDGHVIEAYTYTATLLDPALQPYHWYKEHVLRGAMENHLAAAYIQSIEEIASIVDPDRKRHASELLIYQP